MPEIKVDMNAVGYGPQDLRSETGGNGSRGMLDQVRPTGILATGGEGGSRKERRGGSKRRSYRGRK